MMLLAMMEQAADELGLPRPASVTTTDPQTRQLLAAFNSNGRALAREFAWSGLQTLHTFTTVSGTDTYALPSDYARMIPDTNWDQTNDWRMFGPDTPQMDRWRRESGVAEASVRRIFRLVGNNIKIFPVPATTGDTLVFEYISKNWMRISGSTPGAAFVTDSDTSIFDPDLVVKGAKWRYMAAKGMYADAMRDEFEEMRTLLQAADLGGTKISMTPGDLTEFVSLDNLADGNWSI
jgi:hypothetical protein